MTDSTDLPVILILTADRSGSNLLADMLGNLAGNRRLMEVFHRNVRGDVQRNEAFFAGLQKTLGFSFSDINDPKIGRFIADNRVKYFDALCATAQELGFQSLSCKIFPHQILLPELEQILARPNLRVIFLLRRRIDRHISLQKGRIVKNYINADTTAVLPEFDVADFLDAAMANDLGMDQFLQAVQAASKPFAVLEYDRDINIPDEFRSLRVAKALENIGVLAKFTPHTPPNWIKKQDTNPDWRDKVANGFLAAASLAGLGLLEYAQSAPLMDILPTKGGPSLSGAHLMRTQNAGPPRRDILLQEGGYWRAFAKDPVLSMTSLQFGRSFLAEWMAGPTPAFEAEAGVHFLKPTWSMQTDDLGDLGQSLRRAELDNPGHIFIALHVNEAEAKNYQKSGIRSILGNIGMFEDETVWAEDAAPMQGVPNADALMIAALQDWKNHHLAAQVDSALFIYGNPSDDDLARVRGLCPQATFVNHLTGKYRYLERNELRGTMSRAKVLLALSSVEGTMRACIESLLSGLPVVSPPSIGGRDAFFVTDNALVVDPTPQAVRQGVKALIERNLTRDEVRRATMDVIRPMRRDFELAANQVITAHLGPLAPQLRVRDIFGLLTEHRPLSRFVEELI